MKARNSLSKSRVYSIAILIFMMNFLPQMISVTESGDLPSGVQTLNSFFIGILQVALTLYALLERDETQEARHLREAEEATRPYDDIARELGLEDESVE